MKITQNVVMDLLPVYLSGEASPDTKDLIEEFLRQDPARVKACSDLIRVIKVNRKTLTLFEADDLSHLVENLGAVFRDDMLKSHIDELVQLWDGQTEFFSHTVNYTLSGRRLDIQLKGSILPGHEQS